RSAWTAVPTSPARARRRRCRRPRSRAPRARHGASCATSRRDRRASCSAGLGPSACGADPNHIPRRALKNSGLDAKTQGHMTTTVYDEVRYSNHPYAQTHPDRLATVAVLHGLPAPDPFRARVLEIGCGAGGNLIAMAAATPGLEAVGVDLAQ